MARKPSTKSVAKALSQAPKPADGSAAPLRALRVTLSSPAPTPNKDYAYVTLAFALVLVAPDGSDVVPGHYRAEATPEDRAAGYTSPAWHTWPHAPAYAHESLTFKLCFDATDPNSRAVFPDVNITAYEPSLDLASAACAYAETIIRTLRQADDSDGRAASLPEAVSRLMQAVQASAIVILTSDYERTVGKAPYPHRAHQGYQVFPSVPDARSICEDIESAERRKHGPKPSAEPTS